MTASDEKAEQVQELLAVPDLADALESEQFRRFLDQIPIAIVVSELRHGERIVYANPEFEKLSGRAAAEVESRPWSVLPGQGEGRTSRTSSARPLWNQAISSAPFGSNGRTANRRSWTRIPTSSDR